MSRVPEFHARRDPMMKAVIIYDEFVSAAGADVALQNSARNTDFAVQWNSNAGQIDLLKFQRTAEEALTDSLNANLILIASRSARPIPMWLQHWLEHWAKCRRIKEAAVALFGAGYSGLLAESRMHEFLGFARHNGLTLICDDGRREKNQSETVAQFLDEIKPPRSMAAQPLLNLQILEAHRFWGINE
jgi:hypothetical protein